MKLYQKEQIMKSLENAGMKIDIKPRLELKKSDEKAELYLYGDIIEDDYVWDKEKQYISSKKVKEQLDNLDGEDLLIHINSFGGMTFEGVSIFNLLMDYPGNIDVQIDGIAASAASIVAMAGKTIKGRSNTMLMIHKGWTWARGNADELRKVANMLEKIDAAADETYMKKFNGTKEELIALIGNETYLTAEEALEKGFYDEVIETPEDEVKPEASAKPEELQKPLSLFELHRINKEKQEAARKATNLFAKFKEE
ncbi:head maturation protease, ClpP-related [Proteiniclasticum sp.]|uniref:head maturation protease, ClpP-related n=1 Tax=Proteiniclasticum sp. TaxID=2053595 RepID=UPI0028A1EF45|nr:head maturation protease, ClpP-related [Proteiniclasticum sp.]